LLVVNPPFGLDADVRSAAQVIAPALTAKIDVEWLANN
jgi:23S rRNA A2030 N6-methylase RlmJ